MAGFNAELIIEEVKFTNHYIIMEITLQKETKKRFVFERAGLKRHNPVRRAACAAGNSARLTPGKSLKQIREEAIDRLREIGLLA